MNTIDILEWSLNLSSSLTAEIPDWVFPSMRIKRKSTTQPLPDIIFLNEVVSDNPYCRKLLCDIEAENYQVICSNNIHGNQVAIALNNEKFCDVKKDDIVRKLPNTDENNLPDFLNVKAKFKETKIEYNIIAVRIIIDSKKSGTIEEHIRRYVQFEHYKNYISKLDNVISAGDFNHARILGEETYEFEKVAPIYSGCEEWNGEKAFRKQIYYNYQMIRDEIECPILYLKMETPINGMLYNEKEQPYSSIGIWKDRDNNLQPPSIWEKTSNKKIDHIVTSKNIEVVIKEYDWCFLKENGLTPDTYFCKGKNGEFKKNKSGNYIINKGFPDHAQLRATIELPDKQSNNDRS